MVMTIFPIPLTHIQCDSLKVESMSPALESGWASELQPNKCSGSDTTRLPRLVQKRRPSFPPFGKLGLGATGNDSRNLTTL